MNDYYFTIKEKSEGFYKNLGSKFLGFAFPVHNEIEIKGIIDRLKKDYHDARHHCFAWKLGVNNDHLRSNDDGEPTNSAGKPILGQIEANNLTNILVVVIRYFGGTLLGVGGLIKAYKTASATTLENADIVKKYLSSVYKISFKYKDINEVMQIIKTFEAEQYDQDFKLICTLKAKIRKSEKEKFLKAFKKNPEIQIEIINEE